MSISHATDSSQAKPAGNAVIDQRGWFQITVSCIGVGVIAADREGRVNYLNPAAEKLTSWTVADSAGEAIEKVVCMVRDTARQPVQQPVRQVIERGWNVGQGGNVSNGVSEAIHLRDSNDNVVEPYWDRPQQAGPRTPQSESAIFTRRLDPNGLFKEVKPGAITPKIEEGPRDL